MDETLEIRKQLRSWFETDLGQDVLTYEKQKVNKVLPDLFGYHLLQLGSVGQFDLLSNSRIGNKVIVESEPVETISGLSGLISTSYTLPVASESIDLVVLPHLLEFEPNPHQVLREIYRILIGEGHVIILGFNPWSWWGLWRILLAWSEKPPFCGHYIGLTRLRDWLALLDFEIINTEKFYFRPPLKNIKVMKKIIVLEQLGKFCMPFWGGIYMLVAKKRVVPLTPVKMQWRIRRHMIASGFAEPSTRQ